jgi:hypothetical protein
MLDDILPRRLVTVKAPVVEAHNTEEVRRLSWRILHLSYAPVVLTSGKGRKTCASPRLPHAAQAQWWVDLVHSKQVIEHIQCFH